jgi:hydroxyacylglutathione hydrolase
LALEKKTNPFLRIREPGLREAVIHYASASSITDEEAFGIVRRWKDDFDGLKPL